MELYTPLTVNTVRKNYFLNASFLPSLTIEKAHVPSASPTPKSKTTQDIFVKLGSEGNQTGLPNLTLARTLQQHHLQVTSPTSNITNKTTPSQVTAGGKVPNKAGYTATPVACGWAGAVIEVTRSFGQEQ